jgi:hypothetical protein
VQAGQLPLFLGGRHAGQGQDTGKWLTTAQGKQKGTPLII